MKRTNRTQIPVGRERSISHERLARLWGISERDTRRIVAKLHAGVVAARDKQAS